MANLYKVIEGLCIQNGTNITQMCKNLGISRSTLSELKAGRTKAISYDFMSDIADMFHVDIEFLEKADYDNKCEGCGIIYDPTDKEQFEKHKEIHQKWFNAVKKYGFCWDYAYREHIKARARNLTETLSFVKGNDLEIAKCFELVFKALFSRSLEANKYSLDHPDFPTYCSGMLGQKSMKKRIPKSSYKILVDKYGISDLIPNGTYYMSEFPVLERETLSKFSSIEIENIKKYRTLDEYGKRMVDLVLNEEYTRCSIETEVDRPTITIRHSTYKVSAGRGFDLEDRDSWEEIDIPDTPEARKADFAITIIGNSMEPIYSDGQIVLVREQPAVDIGETGIYIINGGGFIKRNGGDRLIPINPDYDDIYFSEGDTVYCAGKVIGTV